MIWNFDPIIISYGGFSISWYGVIFAAAITIGFYLSKYIFLYEDKPLRQLDDLLFYVVFGVIVGARLGHCLFYDPQYYFSNPLKILMIWEGGLASHGGGAGAILGVYIYSKKYSAPFIWLLDRIVIPTALFGVFVRFANFLNSEIVGSKSNTALAVVFGKIDNVPRHPAQLYEAFGYLVIFIILCTVYFKTKAKKCLGALLGLFLTTIFLVRFMVEYVKMPQASYALGINLNTGQLLSIPFLILGVGLIIISMFYQRKYAYNNLLQPTDKASAE
ncbi:MAG: prolipoprotein diacylglyceryl transferase [Agarilytica sp.]